MNMHALKHDMSMVAIGILTISTVITANGQVPTSTPSAEGDSRRNIWLNFITNRPALKEFNVLRSGNQFTITESDGKSHHPNGFIKYAGAINKDSWFVIETPPETGEKHGMKKVSVGKSHTDFWILSDTGRTISFTPSHGLQRGLTNLGPQVICQHLLHRFGSALDLGFDCLELPSLSINPSGFNAVDHNNRKVTGTFHNVPNSAWTAVAIKMTHDDFKGSVPFRIVEWRMPLGSSTLPLTVIISDRALPGGITIATNIITVVAPSQIGSSNYTPGMIHDHRAQLDEVIVFNTNRISHYSGNNGVSEKGIDWSRISSPRPALVSFESGVSLNDLLAVVGIAFIATEVRAMLKTKQKDIGQ